MKKVFTNTEIVHVFAQQSQSEGRSGSMFFKDTKIYSYGYHYLLDETCENGSITTKHTHTNERNN